MNIFGFTIGQSKAAKVEAEKRVSFAPETYDDGAVVVQATDNRSGGGGAYATYLDLEGSAKTEADLVTRYREMSLQPETDAAIDDIVNEMVSYEANKGLVKVVLDDIDYNDQIKKRITQEFDEVVRLFDFNNSAYELLRRWYIDGRMYYHAIIDEDHPEYGITEVRYIDPRKLRKVREISRTKDDRTEAPIIKTKNEYFIYSEKGLSVREKTTTMGASGTSTAGVRIAKDSIIHVTSGLMDKTNSLVLGYLHKAIKPLNQLRALEDAAVVYRLSRAPERRLFYVDVGSLPPAKAEQYMRDMMVKHKNKLVYDASTGEIRDDRKFMTMLEDYWLPRRDGCFDLKTEIRLLDGRSVELGQLIVEHKLGKDNWVYSVSPTGKVVPGLISWAGVTRTDTRVIDVTLDNGEVITCTPDHKFILRTGEKIEAQNLQEGSSLMPLNIKFDSVGHKNSSGQRTYEMVQNNENNNWEYTHRLIKSSVDREYQFREVIHHVDFNRYNNSPENLRYMDRVDHLRLHAGAAKASWENGNRELHCKRLSDAGKAFFNTSEGVLRREEISKFNLQSENIWRGLESGRKKINDLRESDRSSMTKEDYLAKWSPGFTANVRQMGCDAASIAAKQRSHDRYNLSYVIEEIGKAVRLDVKTTNEGIIATLAHKYPRISIRSLLAFIRLHGYQNYSDLIGRNFGAEFLHKDRLRDYKRLNNHTVVSVTERSDTMDVGTLTIDENHIHHDYHNFALSSGIFVMNSRGTEVSTLPGGQNLGEMTDVEYFQKRLYSSLNVPVSRLQSEGGFNLGRPSEISRDEMKFGAFVARLRMRFAMLFKQALEKQLILKRVISEEEASGLMQTIRFDFQVDNYFTELKEAEMVMNRLNTLQIIDAFVGRYYSSKWIKRNVLQQDDEEIEQMKVEMDEDNLNGFTAAPGLDGMDQGNIGGEQLGSAPGGMSQPAPPADSSGAPQPGSEQLPPDQPTSAQLKTK